jgi:anaerobic ribonucleoside-triphosphate reductase
VNYKEDEKGNLVLDDGTVIPKEKRQRTEIYSRVVGYLRAISQWNNGKRQEFKERKEFRTGPKSPSS